MTEPAVPNTSPLRPITDDEILALDAYLDEVPPALQDFREGVRTTAEMIRRERAAERRDGV